MAILAAAALTGTALAKLETWRQEGAATFAKHHRERVVISDQGRVRLGQALVPTGPLAAERVWDLARAQDGSVFAATGDAGKVFRRAPGEKDAWTVALDAADTQALALAAAPDGRVFAGTGPGGQVIELTDPKHPASRPDPKVQYIWDLAADANGAIYAATGPTGQLWKRTRDGKWSLLLDSRAAHLLCVAVAADGVVYAGSDGEGLIYRVAADGKVSVVYDAPQSEVRCLLVAPDGSLYAGTAAEASGGGSNRGNPLFSLRDDADASGGRGDGQAGTVSSGGLSAAAASPLAAQGTPGRPRPSGPGQPPSGSAAPKPVTPGDNAVYRIDAEGIAREVFRAKALVFALGWSGDRLLVGTGPDGQLYELREGGAEVTPLAKLDNGQILSVLAEPAGGILLGTGDPGSVVRLSAGFVTEGRLVSEVHDARLLSRFGALSWRAELPPGTSVGVQVRTGNVGVPDETWSPWSAEQTDPATARAASPSGRFVQYRVRLSTRDPARSPELTGVALSYRSGNLAPEIARLDVPDLNAADGTTRQTRLNLRWEASDPNDDELQFTVQVRKEGWPSWITLTEAPIAEKTYAWDTTAFPSGPYRVRISASDRLSNSPEEALTRDRESTAFVVDHEPPQVAITPREKQAAVALSDGLTRLVKAEYALDGSPWAPLFPDDGLFDTPRERLTLNLPDLKKGAHVLMIRATDAAGNIGSGDSLIVVKD
ncbi:MAG: hypothetical protein U0835_23430 [Isosphaeraceae bacterium]